MKLRIILFIFIIVSIIVFSHNQISAEPDDVVVIVGKS